MVLANLEADARAIRSRIDAIVRELPGRMGDPDALVELARELWDLALDLRCTERIIKAIREAQGPGA